MSKKIPITNLHHFTDWSATQSENSSIRFDFSSKIHSARAAQTAWQNRSECCWKWMINGRRMPELASHLAISGAFQVQKRLLLWNTNWLHFMLSAPTATYLHVCQTKCTYCKPLAMFQPARPTWSNCAYFMWTTPCFIKLAGDAIMMRSFGLWADESCTLNFSKEVYAHSNTNVEGDRDTWHSS